MSYYRSDLAFIHDDGFGHFATGGAQLLLEELIRSKISRGTILDVGCGSGITARLLADEGYSLIGIDQSEPLIEIARKRVPEATFHVGSYIDVELPSCVAVCAIGEVLNYGFDERNSGTARSAFFEGAFHALPDGGALLFDVAGPDRALDCPARTFSEGKGWTVLVETSVDAEVLTRRIVTFRRDGTLYRRDCEVHHLHLVSPDVIETELRSIGFRVEKLSKYGDIPFPRGLHGFFARKPANAA